MDRVKKGALALCDNSQSMRIRRSPRRGRRRTCAMATVVAVLLVYFNIAALFRSSGMRVELPRPWFASSLFQIFSLFGYYTEENYGYELQVRRAGEVDGWYEINPYDFFPQTLGEANRRLNFYSYHGQSERKARTYGVMADRIKLRHNRVHPDEPIDRVQIYLVEWPKSSDGYMAKYDSRKWRVLYDG